MKKEIRAQLKNLQMAPRKVRLLVNLIRGMKVEDALAQLSFSHKDAAVPVAKLLKSAIANAVHDATIKTETLKIKIAHVIDGKTIHRWMPRALGRATPIRKRAAHVTIVLEGEVDDKKEIKKEEKTEVKKEKKT